MIINISDEDNQQQFGNTYIMSIVEALRRLCLSNVKYNIEIIGYNIIEGITLPDMGKHIMADKLPWVWITQLNGWLNKLNEYKLHPEHWDTCLKNIVDTRKNIVLIAMETIVGINYLLEKHNTKKLIKNEHKKLKVSTTRCINDSYAFLPQAELDKYGIHSSNAVVQDMSSSFDMQKGGKDQIGFQKHFSKYCSSFGNYLNQRDELILNKIQGAEPSDIGRLSLVNIIGALDELPAMQMAFEHEFALRNISIDYIDEYQQLLLLSGVWSYFYAHPFRIEKSVAYRQKEYIKNYRRKIDRFFQSDITFYEVIISIQQTERIFEITVDAEKVDDFCSQLFNEVKKRFPEIAILTLEGFLWSEYVDRIIIKISFLGDVIPGGYVIPADCFKTYKDIESFLRHRSPMTEDSGNVKLQNTCKTAVMKCFAYFQPFQILAHHTEQVCLLFYP